MLFTIIFATSGFSIRFGAKIDFLPFIFDDDFSVFREERLVIQIERNLPKVEDSKVENPYIYSMVREC